VTYFRFHCLFNFPLLIVLTWAGWRGPWSATSLHAMLYVVLAALVFTTPWDNLAAKRGIWGFPRDKYSRLLGYLPIEEYLFFILQTVAVMLGLHLCFQLEPAWRGHVVTLLTRWTGLGVAASVTVWIALGRALSRWGHARGSRFNYVLHLAWFLPVLYLQWIIAPLLIWRHLGLLALLTAAFGLYYTAADYLAVRAGLWFFDEKQITGWKLAGRLPWEEAAFFFLTSLLVAQSYLMLLPVDER
jgi:lycopene cyclase domain-containing protein